VRRSQEHEDFHDSEKTDPLLLLRQHHETRKAARSIYRKLKYLVGIRIRVKHNISAPLVVVLLPVVGLVVLFLVLMLRMGGDNNGGGPFSFARAPPKIREISGAIDKPFVLGCVEPAVDQPRANAVLVVLARNSEIEGVSQSMNSLERHFNRWFHYPYVFLNDEPFNSTFKEAILNITDSTVQFGTIDPEDWAFPQWTDREFVEEAIAQQGDEAIMYGGMESYHHMCRFYSGKFYNHPLLASYDWYWRVEPEVKYYCDITYDPFVHMQKHNKVYGFTIMIKELVETVPNLFRHTVGFKNSYGLNTTGTWDLFLEKPDDEDLKDATKDSGSVRKLKKQQKIEREKERERELAQLAEHLPDEALVLDENTFEVVDDRIDPYSMNGEKYNMCHFWSNFEIARLDFFRSKQYNDYFETLDRSGGFWTERWGDAPVHSLAAGLFLEPEQIHYFRDIGYRHTTIAHCPANAPQRQRPRTPYIRDPTNREEVEEDNYWAKIDPEVENGVGCRCRCDTDVPEVEGKPGSCTNQWVELTGGWV
jgi:mannosyltransferase